MRTRRTTPRAVGVPLCLVLGLVAGACTERLQVLAPMDAGADGGAGAEPFDAGADAGGDGAVESDSGSAGCGGCGPLELCTATGCVDASGVESIAANLQHTCLVKAGRLFCFGKNSSGQLGLGDRVARELPTRVGLTSDFVQVEVGEGHSCALRSPGTLHCWGDNALGQLGLGDTEPRLEPTRVGERDDWERLACGGANCCALRAGGQLYCWGDNLEGKPAQDDPYGEPDVLEPRPAATELRFSRVALGQGHACAITTDGALYGWGRNILGETGTAPGVAQLRVPTRVGDAADWVSVGAAQHHSCGVRADGSLWCWGQNTHQQLGLAQIPDESETVLTPALVPSELAWVDVRTGWFHTCAITRQGALHCMGRSLEGQLAQPAGAPISALQPVQGVQGVERLTLGNFHTCAVQGDAVTLCFGENTYGQLGVGDTERRYAAAVVPVP